MIIFPSVSSIDISTHYLSSGQCGSEVRVSGPLTKESGVWFLVKDTYWGRRYNLLLRLGCMWESTNRCVSLTSILIFLSLSKESMAYHEKSKIIHTLIFSITVCECKSWKVKRLIRKKKFEIWFWRRVLWIPWSTRKANKWVSEQTHFETLLKQKWQNWSCLTLGPSWEGRFFETNNKRWQKQKVAGKKENCIWDALTL